MIGLALGMMRQGLRVRGRSLSLAPVWNPSRACTCDACITYFRLIDACPLRIPG